MTITLTDLIAALQRGDLIPILGPGALAGVVDRDNGEPMPADSDSLILAMNQGRPMAPKLMWEFPRAAMNVELKRGRQAVTRFLDQTYGQRNWSDSPLHAWLAELDLPYLIDFNRDSLLQRHYAARAHTLIRGIARIGGTDYRFRLHAHDGSRAGAQAESSKNAGYRAVDQANLDVRRPVLFKPLGSPLPQGSYIASDADFVDYLTELMGGFGMPAFLKRERVGRQYLLLGLRLTRDTERMLVNDLTHDAATPKGWALIASPTDKEVRFCQRQGIEIIRTDIEALLEAADVATTLSVS